MHKARRRLKAKHWSGRQWRFVVPDKHPAIPRPQRLTEGALSALERFSHIEAVSGIVLLLAAIVALVWANSPAAATLAARTSVISASKRSICAPSRA